MKILIKSQVGDEMTLQTQCPICGQTQEVTVKVKDYNSWKSGTLIQRAFPYLNATQRESLMSGICQRCWESEM